MDGSGCVEGMFTPGTQRAAGEDVAMRQPTWENLAIPVTPEKVYPSEDPPSGNPRPNKAARPREVYDVENETTTVTVDTEEIRRGAKATHLADGGVERVDAEIDQQLRFFIGTPPQGQHPQETQPFPAAEAGQAAP